MEEGKTGGNNTAVFIVYGGGPWIWNTVYLLYVSKSQWDYVSCYDCECLRCAVLDAETALHRMEAGLMVFGICSGFAGNCGLQDC